MILQLPTQIKIAGNILELENVSRDVTDTFDARGELSATYVSEKNGFKQEFVADFYTSEQFAEKLKQVKGEVVNE